jgi:hypothetical protein
LPLLLIGSLAATGGLDILVTDGRTLDSVLKAGRVYILINALVGNLTRFALGPCESFTRRIAWGLGLMFISTDLMKTHQSKWFQTYHDHHEHTEEEHLLPEAGQIALPPDEDAEPPTVKDRVISALKTVKDWIVLAINPPLMGGILAVGFGLIPWFHRELFGAGWLSPYVVLGYPSSLSYTRFQHIGQHKQRREIVQCVADGRP